MDNSIISIDNISKFYGKHQAVKNLNLQINRGEIFGLLGPNGAGKSTTILMLMGMTEATEGHIRIAGLDPQREPVSVKRIIGYLPDNVGFYDNMSALDNLTFIAQLNGATAAAAYAHAITMLEKVNLSAVKDNKVGTFSRGMKQRLGLAEVLIKKPQIIILDEPTLGLDPVGVQEFLQLIKSLKEEEGLTVLLSSHHLHHVQKICDRVGLFADGVMRKCGTINELGADILDGTVNRYQIEVVDSAENIREIIHSRLRSSLPQIDIRTQEKTIYVQGESLSMDILWSHLKDFENYIVRTERSGNTIDDIYSYYLDRKH
ncbi:ABC transporter ATP-binding protein [Sphingobacterium rhinopitheci]|uniref:ABC transporter ATP-binding protein n=1 Tax=Sphingobacterium rhinopitheci TaxID=2781960 RepID=UPI001F52AAAC|nr:ABC transporter ATP-binding protein [Sphingobacterium rhinopitheci]MCI0921747.1 ABC transporter ATP-binding protein [Sphingobacterium rhinopitheci]